VSGSATARVPAVAVLAAASPRERQDGARVIRTHRLRSALLVLGVAIGIRRLMAMVAILAGLGEKIAADIANTDRVVIYVTPFRCARERGSRRSSLSRPDVEPGRCRRPRAPLPAVDRAEYYIETSGASPSSTTGAEDRRWR